MGLLEHKDINYERPNEPSEEEKYWKFSPGAPFDVNLFRYLAPLGLFVISENDYFRGLSMMEDSFQPTCLYTFLAHVILTLDNKRLYIRNETEIYNPPDIIEKETNGKYTKPFGEREGDIKQVQGWNRNIFCSFVVGGGSDGEGAAGGDGFPPPPAASSFNFRRGTSTPPPRTTTPPPPRTATPPPPLPNLIRVPAPPTNTDWNYLNLYEVFFPFGCKDSVWRSTDSVIEEMALYLMQYEDKGIYSFNTFCDFLQSLLRGKFKCMTYEDVKIFNSATETMAKTTGYLSDFAILEISLTPRRIKLCRGWLDHYRNLSTGFFRYYERSATNTDFRASAVEIVLQQYGYFGCRDRDVILPGCVLDKRMDAYIKPVDASDEENPNKLSYLQIMKKIKIQEPSDDSPPSTLDRFLISSSAGQKKYLQADAPMSSRYQDVDAWNYYSNLLTLNKRGETNLTEEEIKKLIFHFSPAATEESMLQIIQTGSTQHTRLIPQNHFVTFTYPDHIFNGLNISEKWKKGEYKPIDRSKDANWERLTKEQQARIIIYDKLKHFKLFSNNKDDSEIIAIGIPFKEQAEEEEGQQVIEGEEDGDVKFIGVRKRKVEYKRKNFL
jgi:hypothetical protein